jgi:hypothetical protein
LQRQLGFAFTTKRDQLLGEFHVGGLVKQAKREFSALLLVVGAVCFRAFAASPQNSISPPPPPSNVIHGTTVVVVSTKDGFVLAGDSRGSRGCIPALGEYEKVFSIGKRSALVLAGSIETQDHSGQLKEAVATKLHGYDQANPALFQPRATTGVWNFVQTVDEEMSLMDPLDPAVLRQIRGGQLVAAVSSVYVSEEGVGQWITLTLNPGVGVEKVTAI